MPSCQPNNGGLQIFQTKIPRVIDEAKPRVLRPICLTMVRTASPAQEASIEPLCFDGRLSAEESFDTADTTSGIVPIHDVHA